MPFFYFLLSVYVVLTTARPIDRDGNGTPDLCIINSDGSSKCLGPDGTWTTSPPDASQIATSGSEPWTEIPAPSALRTLGSSSDFAAAKGVKWNIEYTGDIKYTGELATKDLYGDKCRSSKLGDKIIWNCGDMLCNPDYTVCGFAMGPAFYGTDDVGLINTDGITQIQDNDFVQAWEGDAPPESPQTHWGMDTSNVAAINETHGVAFARQIWRGAPDGSYADQGNAVASITLGEKKPVASRMGSLLTGPDVVELGLLAIMRDGDHIYIYSIGGPSGITVSRVRASDDVFDLSKYDSLLYTISYTISNPNAPAPPPVWQAGLPSKDDSNSTSTQMHGMTTAEADGKFACSVYGSVFYNNYLNKYTILCNTFMSFTNMYLSSTPFGPWSPGYNLLSNVTGYGSHAHPEYSPGGDHKVMYFSQGPNEKFNMFKVSFEGY